MNNLRRRILYDRTEVRKRTQCSANQTTINSVPSTAITVDTTTTTSQAILPINIVTSMNRRVATIYNDGTIDYGEETTGNYGGRMNSISYLFVDGTAGNKVMRVIGVVQSASSSNVGLITDRGFAKISGDIEISQFATAKKYYQTYEYYYKSYNYNGEYVDLIPRIQFKVTINKVNANNFDGTTISIAAI